MKRLCLAAVLLGLSLNVLADPAPVAVSGHQPLVMTPLPPAISGLPTSMAVSTAVTVEQRRQQELVANAEKLDEANRNLLARNQEQQLQLENLNLQVKVLQNDRSTQAIWNGAGAVILGFVLGLFFASNSRGGGKSGW
jgi:hypothetical protein